MWLSSWLYTWKSIHIFHTFCSEYQDSYQRKGAVEVEVRVPGYPSTVLQFQLFSSSHLPATWHIVSCFFFHVILVKSTIYGLCVLYMSEYLCREVHV